MTGKEREKIAKARNIEGGIPEDFTREQFFLPRDYKIVRKIFGAESKKYFEKAGFDTEKKEWRLTTAHGKSGGAKLVLHSGDFSFAYTIKPYDDQNGYVFDEWQQNDLSLFKTMKEHKTKIYYREGGDGKALSFKGVLKELQDFLKENGRYHDETNQILCDEMER